MVLNLSDKAAKMVMNISFSADKTIFQYHQPANHRIPRMQFVVWRVLFVSIHNELNFSDGKWEQELAYYDSAMLGTRKNSEPP